MIYSEYRNKAHLHMRSACLLLGGCYYNSTINQLKSAKGAKVTIHTLVRVYNCSTFSVQTFCLHVNGWPESNSDRISMVQQQESENEATEA